MRIAVLGSGAGSNFLALWKACHAGKIAGEIRLVGADQQNSGILEQAEARNIPTFFEKKGKNFSERVAQRLLEDNIELVCLAGLMRIVKAPLLGAFPNRILNIHPSLLPKFPGKEAWKQALEAREDETGCTVHYVDAGMDTGEIILQERVPIKTDDTPESLHARIQEAEHRVYVESVRTVISSLAD